MEIHFFSSKLKLIEGYVKSTHFAAYITLKIHYIYWNILILNLLSNNVNKFSSFLENSLLLIEKFEDSLSWLIYAPCPMKSYGTYTIISP